MLSTHDTHDTHVAMRVLKASAALLAAAAVALSAYAAHGVEGEVRAHLQIAAVFAFGHGVALAALAPSTSYVLGRAALFGLLTGTLLFAGSIVATHLLGISAGLAPFGGSLMILSWLVYAGDALRR